jgi:hypothetical protein
MALNLRCALGALLTASLVSVPEGGAHFTAEFHPNVHQLTASDASYIGKRGLVVPTQLPGSWVSEGCYVYVLTPPVLALKGIGLTHQGRGSNSNSGRVHQ